MTYYFSKAIGMPFAQAVQHVTAALANKGFGVLTTIDVSATLKKKLDVDFRPYTILGACNPEFALKALQSEDMIGTMLPCNVVVQDNGRLLKAIWALLFISETGLAMATLAGSFLSNSKKPSAPTHAVKSRPYRP